MPDDARTRDDDTIRGLLDLGLTRSEAAVLAAVMAAEEVTPGQIASTTGLSDSHVSTAVGGLRQRGLVDRVVGRRPSVVFLREDAGRAVEALSLQAAVSRRDAAGRAATATSLVCEAAARAHSRGRPMYEVRPATDPVAPSYDVLRLGETAHDEVASGSLTTTRAWRPAQRCDTRLLVSRPAPGALGELRERLADDRRPRRHAVTVRTTGAELPELLLLDHDRVRVAAGSPYGRVHAWSRERLHVHWAAHLFVSWWEEAEAAFEVVATPIPPFDESDLDVDEWDPEELAG